MKRHLYTLLLATLYVLAISTALKILPFDNAPAVFKALFTKSRHSYVAWMEIREVAIIGVIACLVPLLLIRANKKKAKIDAIVIGAVTLLWGLGFRWTAIGSEGWSWLEVSDYLTTALAVPVLAAVIGKFTAVRRSYRAVAG